VANRQDHSFARAHSERVSTLDEGDELALACLSEWEPIWELASQT